MVSELGRVVMSMESSEAFPPDPVEEAMEEAPEEAMEEAWEEAMEERGELRLSVVSSLIDAVRLPWSM